MARETDADVTTTPTSVEREKIANSEAKNGDIALELSGSWYGYIGQDSEGAYHHMDSRTMTIFVTEQDRERFLPDGAGLFWFRVEGPVIQTVCLEHYPNKNLENWKDFVDMKRGWSELPVSAVDQLTQNLESDDPITDQIQTR
ncbi:hypothetical protein [Natronorubrum daqingense]|uniref:Uncharacterized protein n=1 Tax=Natronorubrum daqingense TaxID=588898 RepID=A0A1N7G2L4_9EURY|nr:hypothetical protein [Natronorubrum daqingense]APX98650.1 hypothetical protein BB347_18340 [Natronorubrum daqingense]SIS06676.1 hypothetical protein SAMN05421809_3686 [Natronorubrum daqingense]